MRAAGEHFLVADGPEAVAAAALRIMGDAAERARLARAGRARMLSHHAWESSMRRLDGIIERCVAARRSVRASTASRASAGAARSPEPVVPS